MPSRSAPLAAMVAMWAVWGYSWVAAKIALRHAHPFDFAAQRMVVAALLLFAIVVATGRRLALPAFRVAATVGLLQVALFVILSHFALLAGGAGRTSVLVYTMPFWLILLAHAVLGERMGSRQWLAVAIAFAGLLLIVAPWQLTNLEASLLALGAGVAWALGSAVAKRWPQAGADPLTFTAWQLAISAVPLVLLSAGHAHEATRWNAEYVAALAYSAVFASAGGWWLWTYVLTHLPASLSGLGTLAVPVLALLSSWVQLGERPPPHEWAGMALIGAALALLARLRPAGRGDRLARRSRG